MTLFIILADAIWTWLTYLLQLVSPGPDQSLHPSRIHRQVCPLSCRRRLPTTLLIHYLQTAVWLAYDYTLTFPAEVRCIWQRQFCFASYIFIALRYVALFCQAINTFLSVISTSQLFNLYVWKLTPLQDDRPSQPDIIWPSRWYAASRVAR